MKIKQLKSKLPEKEESLAKFFASCETRKKFIEDAKEHHKQHLKKAKHDLARAIAEFEDGCWDWTIVNHIIQYIMAAMPYYPKRRMYFQRTIPA